MLCSDRTRFVLTFTALSSAFCLGEFLFFGLLVFFMLKRAKPAAVAAEALAGEAAVTDAAAPVLTFALPLDLDEELLSAWSQLAF